MCRSLNSTAWYERSTVPSSVAMATGEGIGVGGKGAGTGIDGGPTRQPPAPNSNRPKKPTAIC